MLFLFTLLIVSESLYAQKRGKLRGRVTDAQTGEALAYANVYLQDLNMGTSTNERGRFFISSIRPGEKYNLIVSYVGYETDLSSVTIYPNRITEVDIKLIPSSVEIQTVEKIGTKTIDPNETDLGLSRISIRELESMPKGVETDIFRSLRFLPGVSSTGDVSARYYVRGGASNQNLVLLNSAPIYNPFHALGMFSVVDPEMINSIEFYKSGFPTEYGGRISSVMKIVSKEGNKLKYGGSATLSFLTAKGMVQGPMPYGSFAATFRKSYSNQILKPFFNDKNVPMDFYDFSIKLNYSNPKVVDGSKFLIHGFFSGDKMKSNSPLKEDIKWSNGMLGFKRFQIYDTPLYSEWDIYISHFKGDVDPKESGNKPLSNELTDVSLRMDFTYIFDNSDELGIGTSISSYKTKLYFVHQNGLFADYSDFAANISLYLKYKLIRFENFGMEAGTRINLEGLKKGGNFYFEPRLSVTWRVVPQLAFKASWGRFQQGLTTLIDENQIVSIFEPWFLTPEYLIPARAVHYNAGLEITPSRYFTFSYEAYYKNMLHLPTINQNKIHQTDKDLVEAEGKSYGHEFLMRYGKNPISFQTAYTLSWAYKTVEGWTYHPAYDSRHSVSVSLEYALGAGWKISSQWFYNTGLPFTPSMGYYDRLNINNLYGYADQLEGFTPYMILGDINTERLPDYHRLDVSLSKIFVIADIKTTIDVSALNVYDRANLFYFERDTGERVNMLPFLLTATLKLEI